MIKLNMKSLVLLMVFTIGLTGCDEDNGFPPPPTDQTFSVKFDIDLNKTTPANRNLLGNNVQWVDNGDELIDRNSLQFIPEKIEKARKLGVSVLRYPGGSLADLYHWQDGLGALSERKLNSRFHGAGEDQIRFGTLEFLKLTQTLNAEPLITVNVITGSAEEAADWVRQTNITRMRDEQNRLLPKVKYWEIGNEPYLIDDNQKHLAITPEDFAAKVNEFIRKMKQVDPSIVVGIPMRSDAIANSPATPIQGYNQRLLDNIKADFDYVSLHNAYFPFIIDQAPKIADLYHATLGGSQFVIEDIASTKAHLKAVFPDKAPLVAITEYSPFFTIGKGKMDGYIASLLGALYVGDLMTAFINSGDVWMANYWSLAGNWYFGAIRQDGQLRPVYHVLEGFNRVLKGKVLSTGIDTNVFTNPKAGFIAKQSEIPYVSGFATIDGGTVSVLMLNKHYSQSAQLTLGFDQARTVTDVTYQTLSANRINADDVSTEGWSQFNSGLPETIPPRSLLILQGKLK